MLTTLVADVSELCTAWLEAAKEADLIVREEWRGTSAPTGALTEWAAYAVMRGPSPSPPQHAALHVRRGRPRADGWRLCWATGEQVAGPRSWPYTVRVALVREALRAGPVTTGEVAAAYSVTTRSSTSILRAAGGEPTGGGVWRLSA